MATSKTYPAKTSPTPSLPATPVNAKATPVKAARQAKQTEKTTKKITQKPSVKSTQGKPLPVQVKAVAKPEKKPAASPKIKLVRDSFTLPESDHALIKQCKKSAVSAGRETKKSEVLRAAIQAFSTMPLVAQMAAYERLSAIAVGRPKSK